MLAALEEVTMKQEEAVYHRIHSWRILVQTWCTLRFSHYRGISPQEVKVDALGLAAVLRRSKTIGTDKSIVSRPLVFDSSCFVKERLWLVTGWKVLHKPQVSNATSCYPGSLAEPSRLSQDGTELRPRLQSQDGTELRPRLRSPEQGSERA